MKDIFWGEKGIIAVLRSLGLEYLGILPDISEGLDNKIYDSVHKCCDLRNLFELIKSKRYTKFPIVCVNEETSSTKKLGRPGTLSAQISS